MSEGLDAVTKALDSFETSLRIVHNPQLVKRPPPLEFDDLKDNQNHNESTNDSSDEGIIAAVSDEDQTATLRRCNLKAFNLNMFPEGLDFTKLRALNVSHNELMDLPGIECMISLEELNLERNWFNTLPESIGKLTKLKKIDASRNFLRPNQGSLQFHILRSLPHLKVIDLTYNQKCGRPQHRGLVQKEVPQLTEVPMTLWEEVGNVEGSYVGKSAAERNPKLLRSQLEPWGTVNLRRRLVQDFGQIPTDPSTVNRANVMDRLLKCYAKEGLMDEITGVAQRKRMYLEGTPVSSTLIESLLVELRAWTDETGKMNKNRERPSIKANNYMILRAPKDEDVKTHDPTTKRHESTRASRREERKGKKLKKYRKIYDLALEALKKVDPIFAERCTEIAVTYGFTGSPHIDKQNCGPFYGFALGKFPQGTGGICVECSCRLVAVMNTNNKIGRVDGRYPHWVDQYDVDNSERYSLIYYETGYDFKTPGPAVFALPKTRL